MYGFDIKIYGITETRAMLRRGMAAAEFMEPALERVAIDMMDVVQRNFESQGRRGGGSWKRLDPKWEARKIEAGLDPRILIARGALMDSVTRWGAPNQDLRIDNDSIELRSELDYAAAQQFGTGRIPARPYLDFVGGDV